MGCLHRHASIPAASAGSRLPVLLGKPDGVLLVRPFLDQPLEVVSPRKWEIKDPASRIGVDPYPHRPFRSTSQLEGRRHPTPASAMVAGLFSQPSESRSHSGQQIIFSRVGHL